MASIKMKLEFDGLLEAIKAAGGNVERAALNAANECAKVVHDELASECSASGVPSSVSSEITHGVNVTGGGNVYEIEAGWKKGSYDPQNPSAAYKAIFLNYGTARRSVKKRVHHDFNGNFVTLGPDRGAVAARGFIQRAKKSAGKKVKKVQKEALEKMLKELT